MITTYTSRDQQASTLAATVATELKTALQQQASASLAVPGGTTPAPFLKALASQDLDWSAVTITLTDERQVPADHERSNAKLLRENFLAYAPAAQFQALYSVDDSISSIASALTTNVLPLTTCVLGMGEDGHFASLFPGADQLASGLDLSNEQVLLAVTADSIPEPRLSLTLAALLSAPSLHLLITGDNKWQVIKASQARVTKGAVAQLPIDALLAAAGDRLTIHYAP